MPLPSTVTVHAPATIANVGCGFDVLGLCLTAPYDIIRLRRCDQPGITITHTDEYNLPTDPKRNVAGAALLALLRAAPEPLGFEVEITKGIRPGSGIGSSAASAAGAVVAANALLGNHFGHKELIDMAMYGEAVASGVRHADNIAPAICGGFTLVRAVQPVLDVVALPAPPLWVAVVHPQFEVRTQEARAVLPTTVPLSLAVRQWANVGGLVAGFLTHDNELISRALEDYIVEPARASLLPGLSEAKRLALAAGALGGGISGSGPSIFMLNKDEATAHAAAAAMGSVYHKMGIDFHLHVGPIASQGARVVDSE
jgi:homoserine kinase